MKDILRNSENGLKRLVKTDYLEVFDKLLYLPVLRW